MLLRESLPEPEFYGDLVYKSIKKTYRKEGFFFFSVQKNHCTLQTNRV